MINTTLLALSLLLTAPAAGAMGTVVQNGPVPGTGTGNYEHFQVAQFDDQQGSLRLESVTLHLLTSIKGGGTTTTSGIPTAFEGRLAVDVLLGMQPLVQTEAVISGVMPNNTQIFSFLLANTDEGEVVLTTPPELAPWVGTGTVTLAGFTDLTVFENPPGTIFFGAGGSSDYTLTYAFEPVASSYCTAGLSAGGCAATLAGAGTPSAGAPSGFVLSAANVEGGKSGLYFFGANGRQANSWGNGTSFQCVVPPVMRAGLLPGIGTAGVCDGSFSQDLNALWAAEPAKNPGAGAVVQAQLWYRDPLNTSNQTTSLSDAVEFLVGP